MVTSFVNNICTKACYFLSVNHSKIIDLTYIITVRILWCANWKKNQLKI
jgi:hypothetical protein